MLIAFIRNFNEYELPPMCVCVGGGGGVGVGGGWLRGVNVPCAGFVRFCTQRGSEMSYKGGGGFEKYVLN